MTTPAGPADDQARIPAPALPVTPTGFITTEPAARRPRWRRWQWIAIAAVVVVALAGGVVYLALPSEADEAVEHCQAAIKDKLFSPSTAVFADEVRQDNSAGVFRLSGELDAENKVGGTIRGEYFCVVRHEDDGTWVTADATVISR